MAVFVHNINKICDEDHAGFTTISSSLAPEKISILLDRLYHRSNHDTHDCAVNGLKYLSFS